MSTAIFDFVRVRPISVVPTVTLSAYSANDQVGGKLTFSGVTLNQQGIAFLLGWAIYDNSAQGAALDLMLFDRDLATALAADNAAFTLADGDMIHKIAVLSTGTYNANGTTSKDYITWLAAPIALKPYRGKSIYGALRTTGTPTYVAANDLTVTLWVGQTGRGV